MIGSVRRKLVPPIGLLWLLPLLIGAGAGLTAYRSSPEPVGQHAATLTLRPPETVETSAAEVNLFVSDLGEEAVSDAVTLYVLDQIPQLDRDEYVDGLTVLRQGSTSWVDLTFIHDEESIAIETVDVLARRLLDDAARRDFDRASFLAGSAASRLEDAESAMTEFSSERGTFDPEVEYRAVIDEIARLEAEILQAGAEELDEEQVEILVQERDRLKAERVVIGESLLEFERLSATVETARAEVQQAVADLEEAEFEYINTNDPAELISGREVVPYIDDSARLQRTALASVLGLVLGGLIVLPTVWYLQRRRSAGRHVDLDRESMLGADQRAIEPSVRQLSEHR